MSQQTEATGTDGSVGAASVSRTYRVGPGNFGYYRSPQCKVCVLPRPELPNSAVVFEICHRGPLDGESFRETARRVKPLADGWPEPVAETSIRRHWHRHFRPALADGMEQVGAEHRRAMAEGVMQGIADVTASLDLILGEVSDRLVQNREAIPVNTMSEFRQLVSARLDIDKRFREIAGEQGTEKASMKDLDELLMAIREYATMRDGEDGVVRFLAVFERIRRSPVPPGYAPVLTGEAS